ncbi:MAG: alpha/beta hydrolase, partial [Bacillota bacterium]|nr:alpha/beta hydrolase [Bacillota bacterium]
LYGYLQPFLEDDIFIALTRMIRDREGDLPSRVLNRINTKCLLIWGEHDKIVPLQVGKRLNEDLKNSELVILKETGHLVPEERPDEVYSAIYGFLEAQ